MFMDVGGGWFSSLRVRLLATLAVIQIVFVLATFVGLNSFLGRFFERTAEAQAAQLGQTIKLGLRQQMLRASDTGLDRSLADLRQIQDLRRIWIVDKNGRVAQATDRPMIGRVLDRQRNPVCTVCHTGSAIPATSTAFVTDDSAVPVIRHVNVIRNEQDCWGCHDSKVRINGIVLVEQATGTFHDALATIRSRLTLTGAGALAALLGASLLATTILVLRPVRGLMKGVARLGTGDLTVRVPVSGRGELAQLSSAFNEMTGDLGRNLDEIRNKTAELSIVYSILGRLTKSIELAELEDIVLQTFLEVFQADQALLVGRDAAGRFMETVSRTRNESRARRVRSDVGEAVALPEGFPADVAERWLRGELRTPVITPDLQVAVLPVETSAKTPLLLMVRRARPFSQPETNANLLALVADHVGIAFGNAQLYTLAITDELTWLFTVRHFYSRLEECALRYKADGRAFSVLMIDLDHFKRVNDRWGHPVGDAVLREIGNFLRRSIRFADSGYRYGGDELAVLLPDTDLGTGRQIAERLLRGIEATQATLDSGEGASVTASIGIAACPNDGTSARELIAAADAALYDAKRAGGNRVAAPGMSS